MSTLLELSARILDSLGAKKSDIELYRNQGEMLAEFFHADGCLLDLSQNIDADGVIAGSLASIFPHVQGSEKGLPPLFASRKPVYRAASRRTNVEERPLLSIPLLILGEAVGGYVLSLPHDGEEPVLPPTGCMLLVKALSAVCTEQYLLSKEPYQCRGLKILSSVSASLSGIVGPNEFIDALKNNLTDTLGAVAGRIVLDDPHSLFPSSGEAFLFPREDWCLSFFEACAPPSHDLEENRSSSIKEVDVSFLPSHLRKGRWNHLHMVLHSRGSSLGSISLLLPEERARSLSLGLPTPLWRESFLTSLVEEISLHLANILLQRRADSLISEEKRRIHELWILQETNDALRSTVHLSLILRMILAGATTEKGLGFNRAALFLWNEKTGLLQGMIGVGPDSVEEAEKIWESLASLEGESLSRQLAEHAENQPRYSAFDRRVKNIRISVNSEGGGTLSHSVLSRATVLFTADGSAPPPEREIVEKLDMTIFAVTPIISRDKVFGVMAVDNPFDNKPITGEDVRLLSMFAGQAGLAIGNARDHRALLRAAEELRTTREQLIQTERLALLGEISAGLAHEIRNPLVTIGGFARRLEKKIPPKNVHHRYAGIIAEEVKRLEDFLDEVLLFGKDRRPVLKRIHLNDVLLETLRLFSEKFSEESVVVSSTLDADLPRIDADANQLRQVFVNLFTNAVDNMPQGGKIFLSSTFEPGPPATVNVSVSDTGGGVDPEVLGNIFNPFYTTKSGGHGLGLALSQRIVSDHAGRLGARNIPGAGLVFTLSLPLMAPQKTGEKPSVMIKKDETADEENPGNR